MRQAELRQAGVRWVTVEQRWLLAARGWRLNLSASDAMVL
jgi:hypothetical protein